MGENELRLVRLGGGKVRLRMPCVDRVGLVYEVAQLLAKSDINIIAIEVEQGAIFLECQNIAVERCQEILQALAKIDGIHQVEKTFFMPSKERAEQLDAVLTSVQDGIIAINVEGVVTQCNPAAARILSLNMEETLGQPLGLGLSRNLLLQETLKSGEAYRNREVYLETTGNYCIVSTIPLRDGSKDLVGVVLLLRDNRDVRDIVKKMTGGLPVTFDDISFASKTMERLLFQAKRYADSDSTILIRGETGTGKELFARALHSASPRMKTQFVPINCAAIPDTLLESELFGYEEGAFTGATKGGKPGLFEMANGGTLFLDEIGEISAHLQAKLLRVLQERKVRRLGSSREMTIDARIIAATNRNLEEMVANGLFREDLYYRLNVIPLFLPPMRERPEDVALLAGQFLRRFAEKLRRPVVGFSAEALQRLCDYSWPGNVRELENIIERAVNLVDGNQVQSEHILLGKAEKVLAENGGVQFETYQTLEERLAELEKVILQESLKKFRSSRRVGAVLGLSHTAVLKKMRKYGLAGETAN